MRLVTGDAVDRALGGVVFKVAEGLEKQSIYELRKEVYSVDWPNVPQDQLVDRLDDRAHHLIAFSGIDQAPVAACRVVPPECRPFDTELYVDLSTVIETTRRAAEIGRLCVRHGWRRVQIPFVNLGILALAVRLATSLQITDYILSAIPRLVNLYRVALFEPTNLQYHHAIWGEVQVMRLDLEALPGRLNPTQPLAQLLRVESSPSLELQLLPPTP